MQGRIFIWRNKELKKIKKLDYFKERYEEQHSRYKDVEDKAHKSMALSGIAIAAVIAILNGQELFKLETAIDHLILISVILAGFSLFCSVGHALAALGVKTIGSMPKGHKVLPYFKDSDEEIEETMVNCYIKATEGTYKAVQEKVEMVAKSQAEFKYGLILIGLYIVFYVARGVWG